MRATYETKAVALLAFGLGLVGLDRFIFNPLFPAIAKDLGLNYQDLGSISATLALCWGGASLLTGQLADKIGRKRVLIPATIIFSLLAASSGLATGLISLICIRGLMGFAEGAYLPASIVATVEASKPTRIGLNVGIQQMAQPLVGLGLGPLIAVAMLRVVSWRWIFALVAIPGIILAILLARVLKRDSPARSIDTASTPNRRGLILQTLRYRNVIANTLGMFCWLSCLIVLSAFLPNYLIDYLKLSLDQMGMVLAGFGVGSFTGMLAIPALSDYAGRKRTILIALTLELAGLWVLPQIGAAPVALFAALFYISFLNAGVIAITVGPLTSSSVPSHLSGTATGVVVGLGEVFGGALAPAFAGFVAQRYGISHVLQIAFGATALGWLVAAVGVQEPNDLQAGRDHLAAE